MPSFLLFDKNLNRVTFLCRFGFGGFSTRYSYIHIILMIEVPQYLPACAGLSACHTLTGPAPACDSPGDRGTAELSKISRLAWPGLDWTGYSAALQSSPSLCWYHVLRTRWYLYLNSTAINIICNLIIVLTTSHSSKIITLGGGLQFRNCFTL